MATIGFGVGRRSRGPVEPGRTDTAGTDRDLLRRFADGRDESAFEVLFRRHGALVLAAARRVLGQTSDAEDVCQAAFLLLAKKAATQAWQPSVAPWLHRTAHHLALKARTAAVRRARREGKAARPESANPLADMTGQELLAVLDAELLALPEPLQAPLVLCYLQGATRDEAAERLGCPLATLKKRLERGRDRLHAALVRRGLGLSTVLFGTLLIRQTTAAVPETLLATTARAAAAVASGRTVAEVVSPGVTQLIAGGLIGPKVKAGLAVLLVGGLLAAAGAVLPGDERPGQPPAKEVVKDENADPPAPTRAMAVKVVGPDGKPVEGANVHVGIWTNEDFKYPRDHTTDAAGVAKIDLPKTYYIVRLWASHKGLASQWAGWEQGELASGKGVPPEYTFKLTSAVSAGGRIVDEKGKPVAGAKVGVRLANDVKPAGGDGRAAFNYYIADGTGAATTNAEGRWKIDNVPDDPNVQLSFLVSHPDFAEGEWKSAKLLGLTPAALRDRSATVSLKAGVIVRGRVTDPDGKPVKDAIVIHGDFHYARHTTSKFPTDADGRYRLPALPAGTTHLTVLARGFAPQLRKVNLVAGLAPQDFQLTAGQPTRLRFADADGKPVKAYVTLKKWKGIETIYSGHDPNHPKVPSTGIPRQADKDGVWDWPNAPADAVQAQVSAPGFAPQEVEITPGSDRTITLKPEHRITGSVTDAVTGKPIPGFTVILVNVFRKDYLGADRGHGAAGKNGRFEYKADRTDIPLRLRIEAPGYRSQTGPQFKVGDGNVKQDFRLTPSKPVTGLVLNPDGKPAAKAEVLIATPSEQVQMTDDENHRVFTDAAGRFAFPDQGEPWAVIARSDAGIAFAEGPADRYEAGTLTLQQWGSVRGRFMDGGKPVAGATVFVSPVRINELGRPRVYFDLQIETDKDGRFAFPKVPPGPVTVGVHLGPWSDPGFRSGPRVPLDLKPGQTADLNLGSGGATLTGKVKLAGKVPADLDCNYSINFLVRREPGITPPPEVARTGFDIRKGWKDTWHQTPQGLAYMSTLHSWFVKLAPDGSFRVSGVPAGEYDLAVAVYAKPSGCLVDPLARKVVRVTVSADDVARGTLRVPEIVAEVVPVAAVGDVPELTFTRPDGTAGSLADFREKFTVVHFWASWCGPCKPHLQALKELHARNAGVVRLLSLSLDEDAAAWRDAVKEHGLTWPQGRLSGGAGGVSSVPAYWLLDADGKIVAKGFDPDEIAAALEKQRKR
jgi:RNA polymerase sigma factor (sigma-70 family)